MRVKENIRSCGCLLAVLALASTGWGCASISAPKKAEEKWVPPARENAINLKDKVWEGIRKGIIDPDKEHDLIDLAEIAMKNNPSIQVAWQQAKVKEQLKVQAQSTLYPSVSGSVEYSQAKFVPDKKNPPILQPNQYDQLQFTPGLSTDFLIFDFGGREASIQQSTWDLIAANYSFNKSLEDLLLSISQAYYTLYSADASLDAANEDVKNSKMDYDAANERFKAGLVSKLDVVQAQSNYENSLYALEQAKGDLAAAKGGLAVAAGLPADTVIKIKDPKWETPTGLAKEEVKPLIDKALAKRPDIASRRASLRSKEKAVNGALAKLFPSVSVGTSINSDDYRYYNMSKNTGSDYGYSSFGVKGTWDIFDGFNNLAVLGQRERERDQERQQLEKDELDASQDVWKKFYNFHTAIGKFAAGKAYLDSTTVYYQQALDSYNAGLKSMLDLVSAQSKLSDARSKYIQSRKDLFTALVELKYSMGELYEAEKQVKAELGK